MSVEVVTMHGSKISEKHAIREENDYQDYLLLNAFMMHSKEKSAIVGFIWH